MQDALAAAGGRDHPPHSGAGDATAVAAARAGEFDRIVCSGGDGTLHEVVAGLMGLENRPEVGYIPAGTTNDFAKNLPPTGDGGHGQGCRRCAQAGGHRLLQRPLFHLCGRLRGLYRRGLQHAPAGEKYLRPPGLRWRGHLPGIHPGLPLTVEHDGGVEEGASATAW